MNKTPDNMNLGHAIAFVFIYTAKYNDGETTLNEYEVILKSMEYWMGNDTSHDELKKILIETDEWFSSGTNFERTETLDKLINLLKKQIETNPTIINEIFEDCVRLTASNNEKFIEILSIKNDAYDKGLLKKIFKEYPLLSDLYLKLFNS